MTSYVYVSTYRSVCGGFTWVRCKTIRHQTLSTLTETNPGYLQCEVYEGSGVSVGQVRPGVVRDLGAAGAAPPVVVHHQGDWPGVGEDVVGRQVEVELPPDLALLGVGHRHHHLLVVAGLREDRQLSSTPRTLAGSLACSESQYGE